MATEQSLMAVIRAARPSFRNPHDKAAFAVHAAFVAAGYVLHDTGPSAFADNAISSSSNEEVGIENWNAIEEYYAFVYSHPEKESKKVLMKCLVMNNSLMVDVLKDGDSELLHMELDVGEYVEDNGGTNYASQFKNLGKLVTEVNKEILGKLDGSVATNSSNQPSSSGTSLRDDRYKPVTGDDTDPEDQYIYPPPSGGDFGGGSMLVGPNDPRFFGGRVGEPGWPGGLQGVPPGARFDPYGPPGVPGFEPGRFARNPRRPGGGTHPDLHHFPDGSDYF